MSGTEFSETISRYPIVFRYEFECPERCSENSDHTERVIAGYEINPKDIPLDEVREMKPFFCEECGEMLVEVEQYGPFDDRTKELVCSVLKKIIREIDDEEIRDEAMEIHDAVSPENSILNYERAHLGEVADAVRGVEKSELSYEIGTDCTFLKANFLNLVWRTYEEVWDRDLRTIQKKI